jgi:hypothetical protein
MSGWKSRIARRPILTGLLAVLGLGFAGGAAYEAKHRLGRRYKPTPYDDLLSQLPDRDSAARLGAAMLAKAPPSDVVTFDARELAQGLRRIIAGRPIADVLGQDAAEGRLMEVSGWLLPRTLALLCWLAAS